MTVGILALQGDFDAHARVLSRLNVPSKLVRNPEELAAVDALILPGGESSTMLKLLEEGGFWDRLKAFVTERPVFGTCAGAILLARQVTQPDQRSLGVLDATVERNAHGRQIDSSIREASVEPGFVEQLGAPKLEAVFIRAPRFRSLGEGVSVMATVGGEPVMMRQGKVAAASFHPELTDDVNVHRWFVGMASGLAG